MTTATKATRKPAAKAKPKAEWTLCECGCGGTPARRTSRYLPGHDAKLASAVKRAAAEAEPKPKTTRKAKTAEAA